MLFDAALLRSDGPPVGFGILENIRGETDLPGSVELTGGQLRWKVIFLLWTFTWQNIATSIKVNVIQKGR
jgi:hypothetical protein